MRHQLLQLLHYKRWANQALFGLCVDLSTDQLQQPQPIKFGSLLATLQHVLDMDVLWQDHLMAAPSSIKSRTPQTCLEITQLQAHQIEADNWFIDHCSGCDDAALQQVIPFTFLDGQPGHMSRSAIFNHVVNHGTYHRGHVASMLYALGHRPPVTDLPVFLRQQNPENTNE